jgi:hypothetical protein
MSVTKAANPEICCVEAAPVAVGTEEVIVLFAVPFVDFVGTLVDDILVDVLRTDLAGKRSIFTK